MHGVPWSRGAGVTTQFSMAGTTFYAFSTSEPGYGYPSAYISMIDANGQISPPINDQLRRQLVDHARRTQPGVPRPGDSLPRCDVDRRDPDGVTQISRASSCAECHGDPPGYNAVGHVYVGGSPPATDPYPATCPTEPNLAQLKP